MEWEGGGRVPRLLPYFVALLSWISPGSCAADKGTEAFCFSAGVRRKGSTLHNGPIMRR